MDSFFQDLRYAIRSFRRTPGATIVILLTLALGIGATTAIFTLINGAMLSRLAVPDPDGLLILGGARNCCINGGIQKRFDLFTYRQYLGLRDNNPYFSGVAAIRARADSVSVRLAGASATPQSINARLVSGNYFSVLGVHPAAGREFQTNEDIGPGTHPVVVISDRMCKKFFGGSATAAVGANIIANGSPFTIVGVMPPGFFGETVELDPPDMWVPLSMQTTIMLRRPLFDDEDQYWLYPLARLKDPTKLAEAEAWMKSQVQAYMTRAQGSSITEKTRKDIANVEFKITKGAGGISQIRNGYGEALKFLMGIVALLLVLCCANVSNLLLAKTTSREQEIVTRVALGASRARIIRQVLTETALIGILGGAAGLAFAYWSADLLTVMAFRRGYLPINTSPDLRVLAFTSITVLIATVLAGLGPAWHTARASMMNSARGVTQQGTSKFSLGGLLVVAQVSICLVLVVVAGLFSRSLARIVDQNFGMNMQVVDARIDLDKAGYKFDQLGQFYRALEQRLESTNGVESFTYAQYGPFSDNWSSTLRVPGYKSPDGDPPLSRWLRVGPAYFQTLGIPLVEGRGIGREDIPEAPKVAVVNEEFVRRYLPGREPIGQEIGFTDSPDGTSFRIVGVAKNVKYQQAKEDITPTFYLPMLQSSGLIGSTGPYDDAMYAKDILVRTSAGSQSSQDMVRRTLMEVDSQIPIRQIRTVQEQVSENAQGDKTLQQLSTSFGALALVIASIGLYGLMMYGVSRRSREMGIRFALGAQTGNVIGMVMRQSLTLVFAGIALGLPLMWIGARVASSLLYGIGPNDPVAMVGAIVVLLGVACVAAYLPARRAAQVDPAVVLRAE